jgi:hypothetical protein
MSCPVTCERGISIPNEVTYPINDKIVAYLHAMEIVDVETQGTYAGTLAIVIAEKTMKRLKSDAEKM